ncbi:carbohydrate esterase family 5 protein, partial [Aulographum hederae CBS 113979]
LTSARAPCLPLEFIISRATTEPSPLGTRLGPALKHELEARLGPTIYVAGLDYPASFSLPDSPETGTRNLVERVRDRAEQCPDMRFAFSGYSQGCDVTHAALQQLAPLSERISSIVTFGDPLTSIGWPTAYQNRVLNFCDPGDRACGGQGTVPGHLNYGA